jgi:DNA-binding LytR/AlgR family response regulator
MTPVSLKRPAPGVASASGAAFLLLSAVGLVFAIQNWIIGGPYGRLSWPHNLSVAMIQWWGWAAFAPLLLAFTLSRPLEPGPRLARRVLAYLAVCVAAIALHLLAVAVLQRALHGVNPGESFTQTLINLARKRIGVQVLTFWALVLLGHAVRRHMQRLAETPPQPAKTRLAVRDASGAVLIAAEEVAWVEAAGNYAVLHAADKRHVVRATLAELLDQLGEGFIRANRSTLVNLTAVTGWTDRSAQGDLTLILRGDVRLRLTRTYRSQALARLPRPR